MSSERRRTGTAVAIHQPVFFPWLGFYHKLRLADVYIVLDDCQATRRSWMNRMRVKTTTGSTWLSIPVFFKHQSKQLVRDMQIAYGQDWPRKHVRTIQQHYARAPFVEPVLELFASVVQKRSRFLMDVNMDGIGRTLDHLGVSPRVVLSSTLDIGDANRTARLVELVRAVGGDTYVCGLGSGGYLEPRRFEESGIHLHQQRYEACAYPQAGGGEFIEGLSTVDTLANVGAAGAVALLDRNDGLNTALRAQSSRSESRGQQRHH